MTIHCSWTSESPRVHVAKLCGRLRLIRIVLRASTFSVLKLIKIVISWVYYTIPFGFSLFCFFVDITFQLVKLLFWLRIIDECPVPEIHIWSILFIKSDLKWCIHLSRSLILFYVSQSQRLKLCTLFVLNHIERDQNPTSISYSVSWEFSNKFRSQIFVYPRLGRLRWNLTHRKLQENFADKCDIVN